MPLIVYGYCRVQCRRLLPGARAADVRDAPLLVGQQPPATRWRGRRADGRTTQSCRGAVPLAPPLREDSSGRPYGTAAEGHLLCPAAFPVAVPPVDFSSVPSTVRGWSCGAADARSAPSRTVSTARSSSLSTAVQLRRISRLKRGWRRAMTSASQAGGGLTSAADRARTEKVRAMLSSRSAVRMGSAMGPRSSSMRSCSIQAMRWVPGAATKGRQGGAIARERHGRSRAVDCRVEPGRTRPAS